MAIDFPNTPSTNDTHTVGGSTWTYDGVKWTVNSATQPADGASELDGLTDVTITAASTGEVLRYNGTAWVDAQLDYSDVSGTPTHTFDGLTDKTITVCDETVYNLTGTALNGTNGPIQYKTLGSNTTFTNSMSEGESITLMLADGSGFSATWPTMTWVGGSAPTLPTSGYAVIELWVVNGTLYGAHAGDA